MIGRMISALRGWANGPVFPFRMAIAFLAAAAFSLTVPAAVQAQPFGVGDVVKCYGYAGTIVRTEPRPGREPFSIVKSAEFGSTSGELRCLQKEMTAAVLPMSLAQRCVPGAKVEAARGISWYEATVLAAPDAEGKCKVHFDGYSDFYTSMVGITQLRARGSGPIIRPTNPVRETAGRGAAALPARAPDGVYQCHKIMSGGLLASTGTLTMRGGQGRVQGLPNGWTIKAIAPRAYNDRRQLVVAVDYVSSSGNSDRMDCVVE